MRQSNDNLLPIRLRSSLHVFLCDRYGAKELSHPFFRPSALESNDVLIGQHWQESFEGIAGKPGHPFRSNSSPEMLSVFTLVSKKKAPTVIARKSRTDNRMFWHHNSHAPRALVADLSLIHI